MRPDESVVRNANGDVILVYRDYHLDKLPEQAASWVRNVTTANDGYAIGYWNTLADIATGRVKFVWNSNGTHRGAQQLIFGQSAPSERKQRISYLATPEKGGQYPEKYAHHLWRSVTDGTGDDQEITNGVLDAIRDCTSTGTAQQVIVDEFIKAHQVSEPQIYQDIPF